MDQLAIVSLVISLVALIASCIGVKFARDSNRIAAEANDIAKKGYESETTPNVAMGYAIGSTFDRTEKKAIKVFVLSILNREKVPLYICEIELFLKPKHAVAPFPCYPEKIESFDEKYKSPELPYELAPFRSVVLYSRNTIGKEFIRSGEHFQYCIVAIDEARRRYEGGGLIEQTHGTGTMSRAPKVLPGSEVQEDAWSDYPWVRP